MSSKNNKNSGQPKIVIIGAGAGGLTCAMALKREYGYKNFTIYERGGDVGGTWRDTTYPGCSSDTTMPYYCLSTELRNWRASHLPQPEVLEYWVVLAKKYNLYPHIAFNQLVVSADWDAEVQLYHISIQDSLSGVITKLTAQIVISAVGIFSTPRFPNIPGVEDFKGDLFHSARWDWTKDLRGKRVGVIGNGASAAQFLPIITEDPSTEVIQFCRTATWIIPDSRKTYSSFRRTLFNVFPIFMRLSRAYHAMKFGLFYLAVFTYSPLRSAITKMVKNHMTKLAPKEYHEEIIPKYPLGCKRVIFNSTYLKALHRSNFDLNYDAIKEIHEDGIVTTTGEHISLDVIILATGYAADTYPVPIAGRDKKTIQKYFREQNGGKAYRGTAVPGFPNFFLIFGPNIATGHLSTIWSNELQVNYIMQLIKPLIEQKVASLEVTEEATEIYNAKVQGNLQDSVFTNCNSWYHEGGAGKITNIFPGSAISFYLTLRKPIWEHFTATGGMGPNPCIKKHIVKRLFSFVNFSLCGVVALAIGYYSYTSST